MKSLILLCLISLSISCGQIDTRPKYISATSTTLEAEMAIAPMNLQIKDNLKSAPKFFEVSGRSIPTSNGIHSVDEYQNIQIDGDTLTFEVTEKLYVVNSPGYYYKSSTMSIGAVGFSKMVTVEATQEPEGEIEVVFREDSESFELKGKWFDGTIISLRYVYNCINKDLFYKSQYITVGSQGKKYGICKVSFEAKGDTVLLGTKDNLLPFDGDKIYYEEACPEKEFTDYAIITRYGAKWKTYFSWKSTSYYDNKGYLELYFPRISLGGNNLILENKLSTPYVDYIDDNIVKNNGTHFLIKYDKPRKGDLNTQVDVTFANSIDNEFVFPMNEDMILDTSTENTRAKAREILANDNSNEPDYIKLGRWVNKHMKYDLSYFGKDMTVDEILSKLIGVCDHFTRLYNALLLSIGIKAVYLGGYAISGKGGKPESASSVPHAWTMAKIDGKWKAFDSTWGLFFDKFPISHVFGNNYDFTYGYRYSEVSKPSSSNDLTFVDYVDQPTLRNLKEEIENALFIREENVKKKEKDLNDREANLKPKENELNLRETFLNEKETTLNNKESTLSQKETQLNEKETTLNNKESNLSQKEKDLNDREANLIPKEEKLNEKENQLNNKETNLNKKENDLDNKETNLNKKENTLNDKEIMLNNKELDLEVRNETLNNKESDLEFRNETLINKESDLDEKEDYLKDKETDLKSKEYVLNNKETLLNQEELNLKAKNVTLINKESQLNAKEEQLDGKETDLNTKESDLDKKEKDFNEKETSFNKKSDSNKIGLIIVCVLLGVSIALNIFLFVRAKKSKDMLESSTNKNEKMTEMI